MIEVRNLTKTFGRVVAVDDLSFGVKRGEAVALWGHNGAGKTTVLRCLLGLVRYRGRLAVDGHDARRSGKAVRRAIGYVPQELALWSDLRVVEALHLLARLKGVDPGRMETVLERCGLVEHARKRVGELSGGLKQRLALGAALLARPPVLVLDELTANLDLAAQSRFIATLVELKTAGKTILFASHRLDEVEALADRVLVLDAGRRRLECDPADLAAAIELRCLLKVRVDGQTADRAATVLRRNRYAVRRNGHGLLVEVDASRKAEPIAVLAEAGVGVRDIEVANGVLPPGDGS